MKDVVGFECLYGITSCGRVWSYKTNKFLKPGIGRKGYLRVKLYKDEKIFNKAIHRLVAQAYIDNPNNLPQVNHRDEQKDHNYISNLEWCDCIYNNNFGTRNKRLAEKHINNPKISKKVVCIETGTVFPSINEASRQLCISHANIVSCCKGKRKVAGGYHWEYVNEDD